jgi:hypothetical protein
VLFGAAGALVLCCAAPAGGREASGAFTPEPVAGRFAVVFGTCAGVFVPGVVATGTHGTGVGILGDVAGAGGVVFPGCVVAGGCAVAGPGVCANERGFVKSAPVMANALIKSICLVRTAASLEEAAHASSSLLD